MYFRNRDDAGEKLAVLLKDMTIEDPLVIAIPRGGIVVAKEIVEKLNTSLEIIIPRKIGAPDNREVAIGAVTQDGTILLNEKLLKRYDIKDDDIKEETEIIINEIKRRLKIYRMEDTMPEIGGKSVILVDDGIATGFTIKAALLSIKKYKPKKIILAVPVASPEVLEQLAKEVDIIVCPLAPEDFYAVGQFYEDFQQVSDDEVVNIMQNYRIKSTQH